VFEKVTVCHLLPQRAGTGDQVVAGKVANWHRQVSRGHSRLYWSKTTALQWVARKQTPAERAQFMRERGKGVPVSGNTLTTTQVVRYQREEKKEGWKRGQKLDASLRGVQICKSTHTLLTPLPPLPSHTHRLSLLPRSCANMDYPKRNSLICSGREEFSKFVSILHRNEMETSPDTC